ncbi:GMC family oxidoreductase [Cellulomonas sp.]|uniref:GMC family oxidoreductase n=1 Tax=Cellulomonas sp. TaxID=40001 RepID=UPI003BAAE931
MSEIRPSYDYVVVGAGAAGCVVANRLSEDGSSVLVLEAGGRDLNPLIHIPVGFTKLTTPDVNWGFETVAQPQMNNREMWYPQGRTLGGSTSINAMIYIRGNHADYDGWEELGNKGWGYDGVLPYFRKSEHNERFSNEYHGYGGNMSVSTQIEQNPLSKAFVRSLQELGVPYNSDVNGAEQYGVTFYDVTQRNARRESASTAFLRPAKDRENLHVVARAQASRVVVKDGRAVGLEFTTKDGLHKVRANREVILSGGAVNSPKLLMLSGIGDADELTAAGVTPVHHLPGVGKNFQDHMDVYLTAETTPVSYNSQDRWDRAARHMFQYLLYRKGPMTAAVCEAGAFVRSSEDVEEPDIQIHCLPAYVIDHGRQRRGGDGITINTCNLRPRSVGSVKLRSGNHEDHPLIDPNFCGDEDGYDWKISMAGFRWGRSILQSEAFKEFIKYEYMPGSKVQTDDELRTYIREWSKTDYHPVGSCKMGNDDMAVVDTQLRVHGLEGLRVIDASIMPKLISGNTQAPSIMIGEKGAAIILAGDVV